MQVASILEKIHNFGGSTGSRGGQKGVLRGNDRSEGKNRSQPDRVCEDRAIHFSRMPQSSSACKCRLVIPLHPREIDVDEGNRDKRRPP